MKKASSIGVPKRWKEGRMDGLMEVDHASVPRGCGRKSTEVSGAYVNTLMTFLCTSLRSIEKGIGNMHYADYGYT